MAPSELRLMRHLGWVVAVKLMVLAGLWQAFVAGQRVVVDDQSAAAHLGARPASAASPTRPASAPITTTHQGGRP